MAGRACESHFIDSEIVSKSLGYENRRDERSYQERVNSCFDFPNGSAVPFSALAEAGKEVVAAYAGLPSFDRTKHFRRYM